VLVLFVFLLLWRPLRHCQLVDLAAKIVSVADGTAYERSTADSWLKGRQLA
jgi:hypothetical protein